MIGYPTHLNIGGVDYPINQGWKVGLNCVDVIEDNNLSDVERAVQLTVLLLGDVPNNVLLADETLPKVIQYLQCENKPSKPNQEKAMDYKQDIYAIWSSIKAHYGIDIFEDDVKWYELNHMIEGLPEDSALMERVKIRTYDMSEVKDPKQRRKIREAQKAFALEQTKEVEYDEKTKAFLEATGREVE